MSYTSYFDRATDPRYDPSHVGPPPIQEPPRPVYVKPPVQSIQWQNPTVLNELGHSSNTILQQITQFLEEQISALSAAPPRDDVKKLLTNVEQCLTKLKPDWKVSFKATVGYKPINLADVYSRRGEIGFFILRRYYELTSIQPRSQLLEAFINEIIACYRIIDKVPQRSGMPPMSMSHALTTSFPISRL